MRLNNKVTVRFVSIDGGGIDVHYNDIFVGWFSADGGFDFFRLQAVEIVALEEAGIEIIDHHIAVR